LGRTGAAELQGKKGAQFLAVRGWGDLNEQKVSKKAKLGGAFLLLRLKTHEGIHALRGIEAMMGHSIIVGVSLIKNAKRGGCPRTH